MNPITADSIASTFRHLERDDAELIAALIAGTASPLDVASTLRWAEECYHWPDADDLILHAVNNVLGYHGVEALFRDGSELVTYGTRVVLSYANSGDTYLPTIAYDYEAEQYLLTSWGDWAEEWEQEHADSTEEESD